MNNEHLQILNFLHEAEKLKSTLRHNWTTTGRQEDSSQHSWRAAVFFIVMQGIYKFDVDPYKTLVMLVLHDLPEATFGDIPAFVKDHDKTGHAAHKLREAEAARKLYALLPEPLSQQLTELNEELEAKQTTEAKVVQALEKIESQLQHLESGPKYWSDEERGDHMLHYPDKAIHDLGDPNVEAIWKLIYDEIHQLTYPEK